MLANRSFEAFFDLTAPVFLFSSSFGDATYQKTKSTRLVRTIAVGFSFLTGPHCNPASILLRGTIVNRTYGTYKNLYV